MSQSVDLLKELLFDKEHQELGDLQNSLIAIAENERNARSVLQARIDEIIAGAESRQNRLDELYNRTGSDDRLRKSVAEVLGGALVQVDTDNEKSAKLRKAMVPFVASTVKTEIRNNHDTLVQVLQPSIVGMVRDAISSAMNDMMIKINRKLEKAMPGHGTRMRAKAKAAGMTMAEMAMAETQKLQVEEIYLIRRGAGQVIGHWIRSRPDQPGGMVPGNRAHSTELVEITPETPMPDSSRDALFGSFLTAITEFAKETFEDDKSNLRSLQLDGFRIYLRRSPAFLLAAKCSGTPLPGIDEVIDGQFQSLISEHDDLLYKFSSGGVGDADDSIEASPEQILSQVATSIETQVTTRHDELFSQEEGRGGGGANPLRILTLLIGLPLLGWIIWSYWQDYLTARTSDRVQQTITSIAKMRGYPVNVAVSSGGGMVRISGLAPSGPVKQKVISDLSVAMPRVEFRDELTILPLTEAIDTRPQIAAVRRDMSQADATNRQELTALETRRETKLRQLSRSTTRNREVLSQRADRITTRQQQLLELTERNQKKLVELAALNEEKLAALELQFTRDSLNRAMDRTGNRLRAVGLELAELKVRLGNRLALGSGSDSGNERIPRLIAALKPVLRRLDALTVKHGEMGQRLNASTTLDGGLITDLDGLRDDIGATGAALRTMVGHDSSTAGIPDQSQPGRSATTPLESAQELALAAERLRGHAYNASRVALLAPVERSVGRVSTSLNSLQRRVAGLTPSVRDRLEAWTRSNAVFFSRNESFRNRDRVRRKLDRLAELMLRSGIRVRVIGFTDATGQKSRNAPLALARATKVGNELIARGLPVAQIVLVGRTDGPDLALGTGANSPNRRVQFETAFTDEVAGGR